MFALHLALFDPNAHLGVVLDSSLANHRRKSSPWLSSAASWQQLDVINGRTRRIKLLPRPGIIKLFCSPRHWMLHNIMSKLRVPQINITWPFQQQADLDIWSLLAEQLHVWPDRQNWSRISVAFILNLIPWPQSSPILLAVGMRLLLCARGLCHCWSDVSRWLLHLPLPSSPSSSSSFIRSKSFNSGAYSTSREQKLLFRRSPTLTSLQHPTKQSITWAIPPPLPIVASSYTFHIEAEK